MISGALLTLGIISFLAANSAMQQQPSPVVQSGATANANPTATATPTAIPTATDTPQPPATPTPTTTPTSTNSGSQLSASDNPLIYILIFAVFVILAIILLIRKR